MSTIKDFLDSLRTFGHEACNTCPWKKNGMAYGISCSEHHFDLENETKVVIMSIGQDPGGTTPEKTGILCGFCNSVNPSDKTAVYAYDLLKTAVIGDPDYQRSQTHPIFKKWYVTNCLKHGISTSGFSEEERKKLRDKKEIARQQCARVLKDEISILQPKLIQVAGKDAVNSLIEIGVIRSRYGSMKQYVEYSPLIARRYYPDGSDLAVFCKYHTSAKVTNRTVSRLYHNRVIDEINALKENHPNPIAIDIFMNKYDKPGSSGNYTVRNGLLVHLRNWLRCGEIIRELVRKSEG